MADDTPLLGADKFYDADYEDSDDEVHGWFGMRMAHWYQGVGGHRGQGWTNTPPNPSKAKPSWRLLFFRLFFCCALMLNTRMQNPAVRTAQPPTLQETDEVQSGHTMRLLALPLTGDASGRW